MQIQKKIAFRRTHIFFLVILLEIEWNFTPATSASWFQQFIYVQFQKNQEIHEMPISLSDFAKCPNISGISHNYRKITCYFMNFLKQFLFELICVYYFEIM